MSQKSPELHAPPVEIRVPAAPLRNDMVMLRPWRLDDIGCIQATTQDQRLAGGTTLPSEFTVADGEAFIRRQWTRVPNGEGLSLAIAQADTDEAVGSIVSIVRPQSGVTGIGYWVVPDSRGNGHASAAAKVLAEWMIESSGFHRIEAWIRPDNVASQHVVVHAGFELEGVLRSFPPHGDGRQDMQVWSRVTDPVGF